jgi:hypothetical protein
VVGIGSSDEESPPQPVRAMAEHSKMGRYTEKRIILISLFKGHVKDT